MPTIDFVYRPTQHSSKRPGYDGTSLQEFFDVFPDDDRCLEHLFRVRFGGDPVCPRCGLTGRWLRHRVGKHYFHPCGGIISPMTNTIFSHARIPLQLWFYAMLCFANSHESISSRHLGRQLGISEPSAYRMSQRIRLHMAALEEGLQLGGAGKTVAVRLYRIKNVDNQQYNAPKTASIFMACDSHKAIVKAFRKPRQASLRLSLAEMILPGSRIVTECYWTSRTMSNYSSGNPIAKFIPSFFEKNSSHQNLNHGLMQYINLSIRDQFKGITFDKLWLYLKEYQFRYNRRHQSKTVFWNLVSRFPIIDAHALAMMKSRNSFIPA